MKIGKLFSCFSLFSCLIYANALTPFGIIINLETNVFPTNEPIRVELELVNTSTEVSCHLNHPGHASSSESSISTSNSTVSLSLLYNEPGRYPIKVNCSTENNESASQETYLEMNDIVSGLSFNAPKTGDGRFILNVNKRSSIAKLEFRLEKGNPFTVIAKVNNVTMEESSIETNATTRSGTVTIPGLDIGHVEVVVTVFNLISSETSIENMTALEEIGNLYLDCQTPNIVNTSVSFTVAALSGSYIQYEFCFEDLLSFNKCYTTGEAYTFNYTFPSVGTSNITVFAFNEGMRRNITCQIELVNKVTGFRLSTSQVSASSSDLVTLTLAAPDTTYYPMEQTMVLYLRNDKMIKTPEWLTLEPGGTLPFLAVLTPPGVILFKAMVLGTLSSQNTSVEIRVGDPLNLKLTTSNNPVRSDEPLQITISDAVGWGFNYTLNFGDGDEQLSLPGDITTLYNESLQFNHTYIEAGTYSIAFNTHNAVHQQEIVHKLTVLHPVQPFRIISNPSVSIPDGWATFKIESTVGTPLPTAASCTIDYGNDTRMVKDVDWVTGFPASNNYKSIGVYPVTITCSNSVSEHSETFTVIVNDRDIDIEGLIVTLPEYVLVNTKVIVEISIETGSNVNYRVKIGSEYDEVYTNQRSVTQWKLQYFFKEAGEYIVLVSAYNSVSRIETSRVTNAVKNVTGVKFSVVPQIVSTTDDFKIFVTTPDETNFPLGPLSILFYKETELLASKTVQSPIPLTDISITASRWRANWYSVRAIVKSPVGQAEIKQFVVVETPIPFFTFTVDTMITIPDGVVGYAIETRLDETPPTNASCLLTYGDGHSETLPWDFSLSFNRTFVSTGLYNTSFVCTNRVSERKTLCQFDVCEFTADGFRFLYPKTVPLNTSSPNVNVRFKYNICGLISVTSDSQISWLFEADSPVRVSHNTDWEEEHLYVTRGYYSIKVFIKSLQTNTETMRTLPLRIGILSLEARKTIGRISSDEFNITASGAYGSRVNYFVEFGDGSHVTVNKSNLQPSHNTVFSHRYNSQGLFYPRVTVWSENYVENITLGKAFLIQSVVDEFDIELDLESDLVPAPVSFTIRLRQNQLEPSISCFVDTGDTNDQIVSFNENVVKYNSFRFTHVYKNKGPFNIIVNCSNQVSYKTLTGTIQLKTNSSPGPNLSNLVGVSLSVFVFLTMYDL